MYDVAFNTMKNILDNRCILYLQYLSNAVYDNECMF